MTPRPSFSPTLLPPLSPHPLIYLSFLTIKYSLPARHPEFTDLGFVLRSRLYSRFSKPSPSPPRSCPRSWNELTIAAPHILFRCCSCRNIWQSFFPFLSIPLVFSEPLHHTYLPATTSRLKLTVMRGKQADTILHRGWSRKAEVKMKKKMKMRKIILHLRSSALWLAHACRGFQGQQPRGQRLAPKSSPKVTSKRQNGLQCLQNHRGRTFLALKLPSSSVRFYAVSTVRSALDYS